MKTRIIAGAVIGTLAATTTAHGQAAGSDKEQVSGLEEIVVTAQRRTETLQNVPIAVTAISRDTLENAAIRGIQEIGARAPSFTMTAFNVAQPRIFIRGIGSLDDGAAQDNSVAVFVDDVYVARGSGQAFDFLGIERVEILRGPQGTLYGKNVVGGLVNVISAKPKRDTSGQIEASFGNYSLVDLRSYVTGALGATTSGSLAANFIDRGGYARNVVLNRDMEDLHEWALKGQVLWQPADAVDVLFSLDYDDHRDNGQSRKGEGPFTTPPFGSITAVAVADPRQNESPHETWQNRRIWGGLARVDWRVGPGTLTSISAYRTSDVNLNDDFTGIGSPPYRALDDQNEEIETAKQYSQEVRYAFENLASGNLSGVTGLYYLHEKVDRQEISVLDSVMGRALPAVLGGLTGASGSFQQATNQSLGAFLSLTYQITPTISGTVGGRYTHESKDIATAVRSLWDIDAIIAAPPTEAYSIAADDDWSAFTPRVALQWKPLDTLSTYASFATGFKSGGYQGQAPTAAAARSPYDPEHAYSIEVGIKGYFFERRLNLNLAVHDTKYKDLQIRQNSQRAGDPLPVIRITNAGEAKAKGVELELSAKPLDVLDVWASYGYLDSKYVALVDNTGVSRAGNRMQFAPENTYDVGVRLALPIRIGWKFTGQVDYRWQDEYYDDPSNLPVNTHGAYGLLDASLGLRTDDGHLAIELWGKNLTDELYATHNIPFLGDRFVVYGAPRTFGVRMRYEFQ